MDSDKIVPGQIILSKAGRDAGRYFVVIDILNSEYVLIADGDLRKIDRPKKKKIKHIAALTSVDDAIKNKLQSGMKLSNNDIKNSLRQFGLIHQSNNKEV